MPAHMNGMQLLVILLAAPDLAGQNVNTWSSHELVLDCVGVIEEKASGHKLLAFCQKERPGCHLSRSNRCDKSHSESKVYTANPHSSRKRSN